MPTLLSRSCALLAALLVVSVALGAGAPTRAELPQSADARLADILAAWDHADAFRGSVRVVRHGQVLADTGVGPAGPDGARNGPDTLYRIASVSKTFAAAAILRLAEQGRLRLDTPLRELLPEYPPAHLVKDGEPVRILHLLNHTSGIPRADYTLGLFAAAWRGIAPAQQSLDVIKGASLDRKPGTEFVYDNTGYDLLGLVVARVSGLRFEDYVRRELLNDSEREGIGVDVPPGKRLATGYYPAGFGWLSTATLFGSDLRVVPGDSASGNMFATTRALDSWLSRLMRGEVVSKASLEEMTTRGRGDYGLGLIIDEKDGHRRITHGGSILGFVADVEYFPDDDVRITILGNGDSSGIRMSAFCAAVRGAALDAAAPVRASSRGLIERVVDAIGAWSRACLLGHTWLAFVAHGALLVAVALSLVRTRVVSQLRTSEEILRATSFAGFLLCLSDPPAWLGFAIAFAIVVPSMRRAFHGSAAPRRDAKPLRHALGIAGWTVAALFLATGRSRPAVIAVCVAGLAAAALASAPSAFRRLPRRFEPG